MNRSVIRASALAGIAAACAMVGTAHAELTVQLGTVQQVAPRPSIVYTGSYGAFVTSHLDASGTRTVTSFDIHGIAQQLGGNLALVGVRVRDTGVNSYGNWSPGADIDLFRVVGTDLTRGTVTAGYQGVVTQPRDGRWRTSRHDNRGAGRSHGKKEDQTQNRPDGWPSPGARSA